MNFLKNKYVIKNLIGSVFFSLILTSCSNISGTLYTADLENIQCIHTESMLKFFNQSERTFTPSPIYGGKENSIPNPIKLTYKFSIGSQEDFDNYTIQISETRDFASYIEYNSNDTSYDVYNLFLDKTYYCKTILNYQNKTYSTQTASFTTCNHLPRVIYVEGVTNFRDLGGYNTTFDKKVKQGLIYRSANFNTPYVSDLVYLPTELGKFYLKDVLKIKSDLDLRFDSEGSKETGGITDKSPIGDDVNYYHVPMNFSNSATGGDPMTYLSDEIVHIFNDILTVVDNYPLVFHCRIGADRTGMMAYLINGLLGVNDTDLYMDYLFTNFANIGQTKLIKEMKDLYVNRIQALEGESTKDKIESKLLSMGVRQESIDTIRNILLESN